MTRTILVEIIGAPIACAEGIKDSWRQMANFAGGQLKGRFGDAVDVKYYDLFDSDCPPLPIDAQLPLVLVDREVVISGGKISIPILRRKIEEIMEKEAA